MTVEIPRSECEKMMLEFDARPRYEFTNDDYRRLLKVDTTPDPTIDELLKMFVDHVPAIRVSEVRDAD